MRQDHRWWALAAISLAILAVTLDVTVLTLALPTLAPALGATESQLQWFVTAYTLALVAGMLPAGLVGDRFGQRTVMAVSLGLFALGSLACAYAPDPAAFIAARVLVALAGAALTVIALSTVTVLFTPDERPRAIGIWSVANFLGLPLGPILGGWILGHFWWGWIFLMNIPVALVAIAAVVLLVPQSRAPERPRIDVPGLLLASVGLTAFMYGVIEGGGVGFGSAQALLPAALGIAALVAFGLWERRLAGRPGGSPLVDLALFRSRGFTWGVVLTALGIMGLFGVLFGLPQYLEAVRQLTPEATGLRLLPVIAGMIGGAVPADLLARRLGAKLTVALGAAVLVAGSAIGAGMTAGSGDGFLALWTFIVGLGAGLAFATAASAALVELAAERAGVASALLQAVVKLGPALGSAVLGSVLDATYRADLPLAGVPAGVAATMRASVFAALAVAGRLKDPAMLLAVRRALTSGVDATVWVTAGIAVCSIVLALAFLPARRAAAPRSD